MRILVVCEGKHEWSGALKNLLVKLGGDEGGLEFDRVSNNEIHAVHGKGRGYFKRALRWLIEAEKRGVDGLILVIDEDGKRERIGEIQEAQDWSLLQLRRAMGVAIRAFDAWMLADERALSEVLGRNVNRQADPETIANPKDVCAGLLDESQAQISQSEMYARVSCKINIDILCDRCQSGFRPFATRVRNMLE